MTQSGPAPDPGEMIPLEPLDPGLDRPRRCPACLRTISAEQTRCFSCGLDLERGISEGVPREEAPICPNCGYSLAGLRSPVCPECGTQFTLRRGRILTKRGGRPVGRLRPLPFIGGVPQARYIIPAAMLVLGLAAVSAIVGIRDQAFEPVFQYWVAYLVSIAVGLTAYCLCLSLWIGWTEHFHIVALRFAGIVAVVDLATAVFWPLSPLIMWAVPLVLMIFLLMRLEELAPEDAALAGTIVMVIMVATHLGLVLPMFR